LPQYRHRRQLEIVKRRDGFASLVAGLTSMNRDFERRSVVAGFVD